MLEKVEDGDVTLNLHIPGSLYVRVMGNAWLAKQYGEIEEVSLMAYFDRALQVMDLNLKNIAVRKKRQARRYSSFYKSHWCFSKASYRQLGECLI